MVLDAFRLEGKVAIVTGCDTGLGQGMAVALAEAGCDVVGVNRKIPHETAEKITAVGRRFMAIQADLSQQEALSGIVTQTVAAFGRVDILVNNAGTIRRQDALDFSEKDWDANITIDDSWFGVRPIQEVYPLKTMDFESQESYNIAVKMVESINA